MVTKMALVGAITELMMDSYGLPYDFGYVYCMKFF